MVTNPCFGILRTTISMVQDRFVCMLFSSTLPRSRIQDAFDLMTGTWIPRKSPSTAMFLVSDSRPLLIRSVRCRPLSFGLVLANWMPLDAICNFGFFVHDLCWSHSTSHFRFVTLFLIFVETISDTLQITLYSTILCFGLPLHRCLLYSSSSTVSSTSHGLA